MSSPTDIPGIPAGGGARETSGGGAPSVSGEVDADGGIRNDAVRVAVEAFAADPGQQTMIDVLRFCLFGPLFLDVTGSDLTLNADGQIEEGSDIAIRGGEGPDDKPAMFAFTSHEQLARMYDDGEQTQSLVQDAASVLELCRAQDSDWLVLDPAGPACVLGAEDIDFALQVPRNDVVRAALEPGTPKEELLAALHAAGPLALAVEAPEGGEDNGADPGQEQVELRVRATDAPDGSGQALVAFTSGPEVVARATDVQIATQEAVDVLSVVRDSGFAGLVINPAGPWAYLSAAEIAGYPA
jgi:hypothetical protein